jgi:hypothetical protein
MDEALLILLVLAVLSIFMKGGLWGSTLEDFFSSAESATNSTSGKPAHSVLESTASISVNARRRSESMNPHNVVMSSIQNAEEKEDEVTRYLSSLHYRLSVLLIETQNKQSQQGRASHILEALISNRINPGPKRNWLVSNRRRFNQHNVALRRPSEILQILHE